MAERELSPLANNGTLVKLCLGKTKCTSKLAHGSYISFFEAWVGTLLQWLLIILSLDKMERIVDWTEKRLAEILERAGSVAVGTSAILRIWARDTLNRSEELFTVGKTCRQFDCSSLSPHIKLSHIALHLTDMNYVWTTCKKYIAKYSRNSLIAAW